MSIWFLRYNLVKQLNSCWTQLLHQNQMRFTIQKQIKLKLFYLLSASWSFSFTSTTAARLWRFIFFMFYCKDIYSICHVNVYWVTSWVKCWCFTKNMKRSQLIFFFSVIICHPNRISKCSVSASFRLATSDFSQRHLIIFHYLHWKPKVITLQCTFAHSQGLKSRFMHYIIIFY